MWSDSEVWIRPEFGRAPFNPRQPLVGLLAYHFMAPGSHQESVACVFPLHAFPPPASASGFREAEPLLFLRVSPFPQPGGTQALCVCLAAEVNSRENILSGIVFSSDPGLGWRGEWGCPNLRTSRLCQLDPRSRPIGQGSSVLKDFPTQLCDALTP